MQLLVGESPLDGFEDLPDFCDVILRCFEERSDFTFVQLHRVRHCLGDIDADRQAIGGWTVHLQKNKQKILIRNGGQ